MSRRVLIAGSAALALITALVLLVTLSGGAEPGGVESAGSRSSRTAAEQKAQAPSATAQQSRPSEPVVLRAPKGKRVLTITNRTKQTIWPAASANRPMAVTGWKLNPGQSVSTLIPNGWNARVWARTGCHFDSRGHGHCLTGDCGGLFQCKGWGSLPATLAEFNLNAWRGMDFYDVSLVDGNNVPMWINHTGGHTRDQIGQNGCVKAGCTKDANLTCPRVLAQYYHGQVIDCRSSCLAFGTDQYCCRAHWAPRSTCDPSKWPINSAAIFKRAEPFAYSYVNDDATSVFTCTGQCDYRVTFGTTKGT